MQTKTTNQDRDRLYMRHRAYVEARAQREEAERALQKARVNEDAAVAVLVEMVKQFI